MRSYCFDSFWRTDRYDSSDDESSDDDEDLILPIDPEKCTVGGAGFAGGAAGSPVSFYVTAKDSRGKRIRDGGAYVTVTVTATAGTEGDAIVVDVKDNEDGTYTATYTVGSRGNYEVILFACALFFL